MSQCEGVSRGPVWKKTGPGTESSRDKGHLDVGFRNSKDDVAVGVGVGEYIRELMLSQIFLGPCVPWEVLISGPA